MSTFTPSEVTLSRPLLTRALAALCGPCPWCGGALEGRIHAADCEYVQLESALNRVETGPLARLTSSGELYTVLGHAKHKHQGRSWIPAVHYMCKLGKLYSRPKSNFEREFSAPVADAAD